VKPIESLYYQICILHCRYSEYSPFSFYSNYNFAIKIYRLAYFCKFNGIFILIYAGYQFGALSSNICKSYCINLSVHFCFDKYIVFIARYDWGWFFATGPFYYHAGIYSSYQTC